jgi:hypothetical protein
MFEIDNRIQILKSYRKWIECFEQYLYKFEEI